MMKRPFIFLFCIALTWHLANAQQANKNLKGKKVLVFTKNGKGYVHENIPSSIAAFQKLGKESGLLVDTTTNSSLF